MASDITQLSDEELKGLSKRKKISNLSDAELRELAGKKRLYPKTGAAKADDLARAIASGATFGWADEAAAAASAATGVGGQVPGNDYETLLAAERARDEAIPLGTRVRGEVAGGVATGSLAGKAITKGVSSRPARRVEKASAVRSGSTSPATPITMLGPVIQRL